MRKNGPLLVLDTNVLVAGVCRHEHSAAYRFLMGVLAHIPIILTEGIVAEYEDILSRLSVCQSTGLSPKQSSEFVLELIRLSRQAQQRFTWRPKLMDEADNKFVEAAIAVSAIIVTYYTRDFAKPALKKYAWEVMTPINFATLFGLEVYPWLPSHCVCAMI